jgi:hypothetical protein
LVYDVHKVVNSMVNPALPQAKRWEMELSLSTGSVVAITG